jgi:hypothetical protein
MTTRFSTRTVAGRSGSSWWVMIAIMVAASFALPALAQAPAAPSGAAYTPPPAELEKLVGRIALYPDDLVAIILPASTNPLQLVQADRYLDKRKADPKLPVDEKWDDAVKSLLNYPEVVKSMSSDLDWTTALGEAVVANQGAVLEAIQAFRRKTQAVGNLKSDAKQTVVVEKEVIKIVPANPQVIYVPQYNPSTVVVTSGYTAVYYPAPYPVYYYPYPPGAAFAAGLIWGAAISSAWNGNHYAAHYGGYGSSASINVNRSTSINTGNINTGNVNVNRPGAPSQLPAGGSSAWKPNKQPGQVGGVGGRPPATRVGDGGPGSGFGGGAGARPSTQPAGGFGGAGAARPSTQPAGGGAFGGYGSGHQAQMDSSRGAASRGSMGGGASTRQAPSSGARQMPSGGGGARQAPSGGGARQAPSGGGGGRGRR